MNHHRDDSLARLRAAALVLHGLHWRDRRWLLRRLLPGWRQSLSGLLAELRKLGMATDACELPSPPACLPGVVLAAAGLDASLLAEVDRCEAASVLRVLAGQPEHVQHLALILHDWRWRDSVWRALPRLHRLRLAGHAEAAGNLAPRLGAALLFALASRLRDLAGADAASFAGNIAPPVAVARPCPLPQTSGASS